jgi:hypothetical protein
VVEQGGLDDAAGAEAERVDVGRPRDLPCHPDGPADALGVGVEVPVGLLPRRVAPADHEDREPLVDRVLDEAASGPQVEEVEAADRRRDDHQRPLAHLRRPGGVLDELDDVVAVDDRALGDAEVAADLVGGAVGLRRHAAVVQQVAGHLAGAAQQAEAAGVERLLHRGGVPEQRVGRGHAADQRVEREAGPLDVPPVRTLGLVPVDHAAQRGAPRRVRLADPAVGRVHAPGRVGEPLVLLGRGVVVRALGDRDEVLTQPHGLVGEEAGTGERGDQATGDTPRGRDGDDLTTLQRRDGVHGSGVGRAGLGGHATSKVGLLRDAIVIRDLCAVT